MNILHLLSQNHLTGAEVYAATLAKTQQQQKHTVFAISNGFYYPTSAISIQKKVETKSKLTFFKNVFWIRQFIKRENIQLIHAHSRAASKLGWWCTLFSKTALVSTVHGVQHPSTSKKIINQYGKFIIAVCENVKVQLLRDFGYRAALIKVIPNAIDPALYSFQEAGTRKKIAIVGRTTGPKKERTEQVLTALGKMNLNFDIVIAGGNLSDLNLAPEIKAKVQEIKFNNLNSHIYSQFALVIGSGRVCMESLISGIPTIAFGEAAYAGLVTPANFSEAITSNFGDIHPDSKTPVLPEGQFADDVKKAMLPLPLQQLSQMATHEFSLLRVCERVQRLYESAVFLKHHPKWIPILMYHKIPDHEIQSEHKIFVTKSKFKKHLQFFKNRGFTTLTFSEISDFRSGLRPMSQFPKKPLILTFDDGYEDNLLNASPLLAEFGFKAQLFLLAESSIASNQWDLGGTEPSHKIVSGAERQKWKSSKFEVGSHGFSHRKFTSLNDAEALHELTQSKKLLEAELNSPVKVFAFTYGITDQRSVSVAEASGYEYAANTDSGGMLMEEEPFSVFRVNIFPDENFWSLFKKTSGWYRKYYFFKRKR